MVHDKVVVYSLINESVIVYVNITLILLLHNDFI